MPENRIVELPAIKHGQVIYAKNANDEFWVTGRFVGWNGSDQCLLQDLYDGIEPFDSYSVINPL